MKKLSVRLLTTSITHDESAWIELYRRAARPARTILVDGFPYFECVAALLSSQVSHKSLESDDLYCFLENEQY